MGGLLSFLSGGAFRYIMGEFSSWMTKRQDHKQEVEKMKLQGQLDADQHARNLAAQKQQAELGYKTINVQADADIARVEAEAWRSAVEKQQAPTGIKFVDAANALVRPSYAYFALALWVFQEVRHMALNGWVVTAFSLDIIAVVIGFYFVDRKLQKAGK